MQAVVDATQGDGVQTGKPGDIQTVEPENTIDWERVADEPADPMPSDNYPAPYLQDRSDLTSRHRSLPS